MNEKNLAAIRAAALALVRQAELAGVVVTIATVPGVPLAMRNYRMEVDVRAWRDGTPVAADLSEQDAGLLEQGASMLEALANDERNRGNDSSAAGAECSAHAVRRLALARLAPKGREFHAVIAPCGEGVLFSKFADARWTFTGCGTGSDGVGVPTIGDSFRESYDRQQLELVVVRVVEGAAA